jgi:hypothetical protein
VPILPELPKSYTFLAICHAEQATRHRQAVERRPPLGDIGIELLFVALVYQS